MRYSRFAQAMTGLWAALLLMSACGGPAASPTAIPRVATATSSVVVAKDIAYTIPAQPTAHEWLLDVYAPPAAGDWPAVVFFHGGAGQESKEGYSYQALAQAIAEQGAVVFVPDLDIEGSGKDLFRTENGIGMREELEGALCAIRFAREMASEYGGRSDEVVVIGHSGGGYDAMMTALVGDDAKAVWDAFASNRGGPPRQMECTAGDTVSGQPDMLIGYAGAYMYFDQVKDEDPELYAVVSPTTYIGRNPDVVMRLIAGGHDVLLNKSIQTLNEQLSENLLAAGYDVSWTVADAGHLLEAPAREAILNVLIEMMRQ